MNRQIYEKNLEALVKKYPIWANIVKANTRKKRNFDVDVEQSYTGEVIFKVRDRGRIYYLSGRYAPSAVAECWLTQQGEIDKFASIIIIGISNGTHIRQIMDAVPKTANILIYEPSYEIFRRAMEEVDLTFLFQPDIPVGIIVESINGFERGQFFRYFVTYDNMASIKIFLSGNYKKLFEKEVGEFIKALQEYLQTILVSWETQLRYTNVNAVNVFHNLHYLYEGYSVADLKGILPQDIPVIIVSAGPSLSKNLKDLKAAMGKACIIATDTAMKPLLNAGIIPDLFVIVDGLKPKELFEHKDISKVGMVTMTAVSPGPMNLHNGRKYFYFSDSLYETELIRKVDAGKKRNVLLPDLPTGGSVATSAYSLGVYMGSKTVILVGQDLALTGNKAHVDGAFENEICEIDMESGGFLEVDAVDGGKVITRGDLKLYLDWFENIIKDWPHIVTVDATEGGALIHGAKNMTLKKAIKKYCTKKYNAKWHLARVPKLFETEIEKEYALTHFEDSTKRLEDVKRKAVEGIRAYERIDVRDPFRNQKQFRRIYKIIKKINMFMEKDEMAQVVRDSLKGMEYTLRPTIYFTKEDRQDEIHEIAQQGKLLLTAILYAAEEIEELAQKTIVPYAKKQRGKQEERYGSKRS